MSVSQPEVNQKKNSTGANLKQNIGKFLNKMGIIVVVVLLCLLFSVLSSDFLTWNNIVNVARQTSISAILAAGMTFVILTGGIDLSIGAIVALAGVCAVSFSGFMPAPLAIIGGITVGGLAGYVNGILTSVSRLPAIIVTLGSMTYLRGIAYVVTGGYPLMVESNFFKSIGTGYLGPIPVPVIIMIAVFAIAHVVLKYTSFGRNIYMVGGNEEAARLTGIKVTSSLTWVYTISGICAGIAGVILAARLFSAQPNAGMGYELDAIAAVVLGGTSLVGGVGFIVGSLFGALFMGVLSNGLTLLNVPYYWQLIIKGLVIVLAIYIDRVRRKKS
ncbi:ABC transporter permease [Aquibacillus saliphilus]|uniref:ABC transporter permease n=1 Tax=Aquibacillus saliphilus TaxID=1909422 RepID=UPI001CF0AF45|nr:ABC transporter permease [Aquibacillus saliphilus]